MADSPIGRADPARRRSPLGACAALVATVAGLAGCGGQSAGTQVTAVARAYDRAFLAGNGPAVCSLLTPRLRRELTGTPGAPGSSSCAQFISFLHSVRDTSALDPTVTAVRIHGTSATATVRSTAGVATFPLAREANGWRVSGSMHYIIRTWLEADYRVSQAGGLSTASVASILDRRARTFIGALVETQAIGPGELRLAVAEPVRLSDLAPVTRRDQGRLAFYDWEANALTPAGTPVSDALREHDGAATLISQGSGSEPPGGAGGLPLRAAMKLAAGQRPAPGIARGQSAEPGVPRGWTIVAGYPPSRADVAGGTDPAARYFVLRDRAALTRPDIAGAYPTFDARGRPAIGIQFTGRGGRAFGRLTAGLARRGAMLSTPGLAVNQHFAAVLDGKLLSVIFVNYQVYPHGIPSLDGTDIAGDFSPLTLNQLAHEIAASPLPADLHLIRSTTVSRRVTAGADLPAGVTTGPHRPAGSA